MNWNPYLIGNDYLGHSVFTNYFAMTTVLASMFLMMIIIMLFLRNGHGYTVHDTEAHSTIYAGVIQEGHGGMTLFLWLFFAFLLVWTIVYFVQHAAEFNIWFAF